MTARYALAFSSAVLAAVSFASVAHAVSAPQAYPANTLTYSAQSVTANGNAVTIPLAAFSFVLAGVDNNTTPPAAGQVAIAPPPGTTFTLPAAGGTYFFDCGPNDTVAGGNGGASPGATAAPFATVSVDAAGNISNNVAFTAPCKNGDHVILNSTNNVGVTLNSAVALATNGGALTLYAIYTAAAPFGSDSAPFPLVTLLSADPVVFTLRANNQVVDVSGAGGSIPGTVFAGTGNSLAGFLGWISVRADLLLNAATGGPITTASASPNAFPTGETTTISGNFGSIASAYLVVGATTGAACVSPAPAGNIPATSVSPTQLVFNTIAPPNFGTRIFWAVCVLNTASQQIQTTSTIINAVANNPASSPNLTGANVPFGSIAPNGAVAFFQNVFGTANLYPTFFRASNPGTSAANVLAVLTFDGGPGPFLCTNPAAIAPGATPVPAGNAAFILADSIATCVGQSLTAGSKHATVKLFSPSTGVLFSAISQNTATTGDLSALP